MPIPVYTQSHQSIVSLLRQYLVFVDLKKLNSIMALDVVKRHLQLCANREILDLMLASFLPILEIQSMISGESKR